MTQLLVLLHDLIQEQSNYRDWQGEAFKRVDLKATRDQYFLRASITSYRTFQIEDEKRLEICSSEWHRLASQVPAGTLANITVATPKCAVCGIPIVPGHGRKTCSGRCKRLLSKTQVGHSAPSTTSTSARAFNIDTQKSLSKTQVLQSGRYTIEVLSLPALSGRVVLRNIEPGSRNPTFCKMITRLKADRWTEGATFTHLDRIRADTQAARPSWQLDPYTSDELLAQVGYIFSNPRYGTAEPTGEARRDVDRDIIGALEEAGLIDTSTWETCTPEEARASMERVIERHEAIERNHRIREINRMLLAEGGQRQ